MQQCILHLCNIYYYLFFPFFKHTHKYFLPCSGVSVSELPLQIAHLSYTLISRSSFTLLPAQLDPPLLHLTFVFHQLQQCQRQLCLLCHPTRSCFIFFPLFYYKIPFHWWHCSKRSKSKYLDNSRTKFEAKLFFGLYICMPWEIFYFSDNLCSTESVCWVCTTCHRMSSYLEEISSSKTWLVASVDTSLLKMGEIAMAVMPKCKGPPPFCQIWKLQDFYSGLDSRNQNRLHILNLM